MYSTHLPPKFSDYKRTVALVACVVDYPNYFGEKKYEGVQVTLTKDSVVLVACVAEKFICKTKVLKLLEWIEMNQYMAKTVVGGIHAMLSLVNSIALRFSVWAVISAVCMLFLNFNSYPLVQICGFHSWQLISASEQVALFWQEVMAYRDNRGEKFIRAYHFEPKHKVGGNSVEGESDIVLSHALTDQKQHYSPPLKTKTFSWMWDWSSALKSTCGAFLKTATVGLLLQSRNWPGPLIFYLA